MLRAVLFDLDDTLLDWSARETDWVTYTRGCLRPVYDYLVAEGHAVPGLDQMTRTYGEQARHVWDTVCEPHWICPRHIDILRNTLQALNVAVEKLDLEKLQRLYRISLAPGVKVYQDVDEVLVTLRNQGIKIGLITNSELPMWMRDVELGKLGILDFIEVRLTAGDVGHLKPHSEPFRRALDLLGTTPDEAVFVGDRVQDDVAGAQSIGMRAVWVRRGTSIWPDISNGHKPARPNATISQLRELLATLDLWFPGWRRLHDAQSRAV